MATLFASGDSMSAPSGARLAPKQRGRKDVREEMRARCIENFRKERQRLLWEMREREDSTTERPAKRALEPDQDTLREVARSVVRREALSGQTIARCGASSDVHNFFDEDWDEDELLSLEEDLLNDLAMEAELRAEEDARLYQELEEQQRREDEALYEQHMLDGVPCPLCGFGRLEHRESELCCSSCIEMRVPLMDRLLTMDDIFETLGFAECAHRQAGCHSRPVFCIREEGMGLGSRLFLCCEDCGWSECTI
mmetsp:Transcript_621/g.1232  ORF Transcript_621/g.1232 Transcript_621/m.1232 type:complete len:253 (+) Transcript_621:117-875(+)